MKGLKLVIIGAGSVYTPEIFNEVIRRADRMWFEEIVLVDIPEGYPQAQLVEGLAGRMLNAHNYKTKLSLTLNRREALVNADFVISQIRVGRMAARAKDEGLGMELGLIGQETTGVGGFTNALRTIPVALAIAKDMEEICPQAWLINFTNPSGIVTEAVLKHSSISCIGLCNVPINMVNDIANLLERDRRDVHCQFMGLNHLSFITAAKVDEKDILPQVVAQIGDNATLMKNIPKVKGADALTQLLGVIPSPYLQYYYFEGQMLAKQIKAWDEHRVSRAVQVERINERIFSYYKNVNVSEVPKELSERGGSLYSFAALNIIEALCGENEVELVANVQNHGAIAELRDDDVVEINCMISSKGVKTISAGKLPEKVSGLVQMVKQYERTTIRAAVERSKELAVGALINHPLVHGFENAQKAVERACELFPDTIHIK